MIKCDGVLFYSAKEKFSTFEVYQYITLLLYYFIILLSSQELFFFFLQNFHHN